MTSGRCCAANPNSGSSCSRACRSSRRRQRCSATCGNATTAAAIHASWLVTPFPLASRILAVADAYDTMTRPRGHREPLTPSQAVEEIVAGRGTQFDPSVAELILDLLGHSGLH